jgi:putative hemolysin
VLGDIALVLLFILIGALFVAAEIALVSLREGQVRALADKGSRGARVASLAADPNRFLAGVQIGVTVFGFLSAAIGAERLSDNLTPALEAIGLSESVAGVVALLAITLMIAYVSLVIGELVPKRLALAKRESIALALGPVIDRIAVFFRPVIWLLSHSTNGVLRLMRIDPNLQDSAMSEEEVVHLISRTETLTEQERVILEDVFDAGEKRLHEVMIPRTEVDFLDADLPVFKALKIVTEIGHSRYPVVQGSFDDVIGFIHVRDLIDPDHGSRTLRIGELARDVLLLPGTKHVLPALGEMRAARAHLAIVVDEYGGTDGIVTLEDLVEQLVGDIRDEHDDDEGDTATISATEFEVDGLLSVGDFEEETAIELPEGPYETVGGFLVAVLGRIPTEGEQVTHEGHEFLVQSMEGRRVGRIRVTRAAMPVE